MRSVVLQSEHCSYCLQISVPLRRSLESEDPSPAGRGVQCEHDEVARVTAVNTVNNVNMVEGCEGDLVTAGRGLQLGHSEHCEH